VGAALIVAGSAVVSAQLQLPSGPAKKFGTSITGAYEGWFDNQDGTHVFLVGYFNRNTEQTFDIPIGPANKIEGPGALAGPDLGQPTHFLAGRQVGMFTITVPKEFTKEQKLTWTLTANGETTQIPLRMNIDYNVAPFSDVAVGNKPPIIKFSEPGPTIMGPIASVATATPMKASLATPLDLSVWATDDAKYSSGSNAPMRNAPPPVELLWSKYRGPGDVTFSNAKPKLTVTKGGKVNEPFEGNAKVTAKFSQAGDYILHAMATDYSGFGGGGEVCCWTTAMIKVTVTP
jgi:hypothetical protein